MDKWREEHKQVIDDFLKYLYKQSDNYILKGGTALMQCYGLDRFSEDIDLDGKAKGILNIVSNYCKQKGYSVNINKDTDTTQRAMLHYGIDESGREKTLKIETSYRQKNIPSEVTAHINGIHVYNINRLATLKSLAYVGRDKIRDLYDICFITNNYFNQLNADTKIFLADAFQAKGIEQFDYIIDNQNDPLIDKNKLADDFLSAYDKLGLIADEPIKKENKVDLSFFNEPLAPTDTAPKL